MRLVWPSCMRTWVWMLTGYVRVLWVTVRLADISGVPGTGKTATVHAAVRELKRMAEQNVRICARCFLVLV